MHYLHFEFKGWVYFLGLDIWTVGDRLSQMAARQKAQESSISKVEPRNCCGWRRFLSLSDFFAKIIFQWLNGPPKKMDCQHCADNIESYFASLKAKLVSFGVQILRVYWLGV